MAKIMQLGFASFNCGKKIPTEKDELFNRTNKRIILKRIEKRGKGNKGSEIIVSVNSPFSF